MVVEGSVSCTAFDGDRCIASGEFADVVLKTKAALVRGTRGAVLIFDDRTGELVEVDFRGTADEVLLRLNSQSSTQPAAVAPEPPVTMETVRRPGRPKLGVVAHEVTLLPRHWDWLNEQPGGASVTLRKLVEEARRNNATRDRVRRAQEAAYRFMTALAGNYAGYEEATRALFASDGARFEACIAAWPGDVRDHAKKIATAAFHPELPS